MKKIIAVMGVVTLLAVIVLSIGVVSGDEELKVDVLTTFATGSTVNLPAAGMAYVEQDIFDEGDAGGTVIGQVTIMVMATKPVGVSEAMGLFVYKIFGEGEIHVTTGPSRSTNSDGTTGVITGGTGVFRGVSGESLFKTVAGVGSVTFMVDKSRRFHQ